MRVLVSLMAASVLFSCGSPEPSEEQGGGSDKGLNVADEGTKPDDATSKTPKDPTSAPNPNSETPGDGSNRGPASGAQPTDLATAFELPARSPSGALQTLWATYYYTPRLYHVEGGFELLQLDGRALGPRLSKAGWCQSAMEGSVQIYFQNAWRTYNYAGVAGTAQVYCSDYYDHPVGRTRYKVARGEFGDGVRNYILNPFRTIAVDPEVIPYGSVVYIPSARGLEFTLPSGQKRIHDGYFFAADTGGLINGNHIDVFLGIETKTPFSWITSNSRSRIPYEVVESAEIRNALSRIHQLN